MSSEMISARAKFSFLLFVRFCLSFFLVVLKGHIKNTCLKKVHLTILLQLFKSAAAALWTKYMLLCV